MKIESITVECEVSRSHNFQTVRERASVTLSLDEGEKIHEVHKKVSERLYNLVSTAADDHLYALLNPSTE